MNTLLLLLILTTVTPLECDSGKVLVGVTRVPKNFIIEESLFVYSGTSTSGTPVYEIDKEYLSQTLNEEFCITPGIVTLVMKDSYGDGWSSGSTVTFTVGGQTYGPYCIPSHGGSRAYTEQTETFNLISFVSFGESWRYSNQAQTTDDWKTAAVDWNEVSSYPTVTTVTRYFQKTYNLPTTELPFGVSMSVKTNSGFIAYLNGKEVFSWGMPTSDITPTTYATESAATTARSFATLFNLIDVTPGLNYTIAIEMHAHASTMNTDECFDAKMDLLLGDEAYRIDGGYYTGSPAGYDNEQYPNLFDNNPSTKWCLEHFTGDVATVTYTWGNGRREVINRYSFTTANDASERDPNKWRVYGSNNNGTTWTLLDFVQNYEMPTTRLTKQTFDLINFTPFASFKFEFLDKRSTLHTLQLGDIGIYIHPSTVTAMALEYPETVFTLTRYIDEMAALPNYAALFNNWSIQGPNQAALPAGVVFDPVTGAIQGVPTVNLELTVYTVYATSVVDGLNYNATISISVSGCDLPNNMYVFFSKYNSYNTNEMFEVRNAQGAQIHQHVPEIEHPVGYCLPVGSYTVRLYTTNGQEWASDSTFTAKAVIVGSQHILAQTRLQNDSEKTFVLSITYPLPPVAYNTGYKYLIDGTLPTGWNTASFSDAAWTTLSDTARPTSTSAIMLYRNSFSVSSLQSIHGFEILVKARAGILIYLNNNEIFRVNLPTGDLTTSTLAIAGTVNAKWTTVTGCASLLQTGVNTIAVAIVNINASSHTVDFDLTMRLMGESTNIPRYFSFTNPDDTPQLFDNNLSTETSLSSAAPKTGTILFEANRFEVINEYCFYTSNGNPADDPRDWTLSGSPDGTTWEVIDTQTNVFFMTRMYQHCFFLPNQNKAYNGYRVTFNANAGGSYFKIASLELFLENLAALTLPELSFEPSAIVGYTNVPLPQSSVSSDYYTFFTISPALPQGFTLNTATGGIYGTPTTEIPATTYTISALNQLGETKTTTITLTVTACTGDMTFFSLEFHMSSQASSCSYELKETASGTIVSQRSAFINNVDVTVPLCAVASKYNLILRSTGTAGWGSNMVYIRLSDNSVLLKESLAAGVSEKSYAFNAAYAISPTFSEWNYLVDGSEAPANWNTVAGAPASWSTAKSGSYPAATGVTQYYYKKFEASAISDYSLLEMSCTFHAGVVVYLNGVEILRKNLASDLITSSTQATAENMVPERLWVSELVQKGTIVEGTNILAFELHRYQTNEAINSFDGSAWFIIDGMYMMTNGEGSTSPVATGSEGSSMAFDNNSSTKVFIGSKCEGVELIYTYPANRYETISNYGLVAANDCNVRHPSGWVLEGSNDNENWAPLSQKNNQLFTSYYQQIRHSFYNEQPYNTYRLTITECKNTNRESSTWCNPNTFQLADFYLFAKRIDGLCPRDGKFNPAMNGDRSYAECPELYEGALYKVCTDGVFGEEVNGCLPATPQRITLFTREYIFHRKKAIEPIAPTIVAIEYTVSITPDLPAGLVLDTKTGVISGTPTVNQAMTSYTMTVQNVGGERSIGIRISVEDAPINWTLILIVVVVVVVVVLVLVALVLSKKGKSAKPGKPGKSVKKMTKMKKTEPKKEVKKEVKKVEI